MLYTKQTIWKSTSHTNRIVAIEVSTDAISIKLWNSAIAAADKKQLPCLSTKIGYETKDKNKRIRNIAAEIVLFFGFSFTETAAIAKDLRKLASQFS